MNLRKLLSWWTFVIPAIAVVALALSWGRHVSSLWLILLALILIGAVLAAVHHAETIAHHVGEPFGSLLLAVAVTVIEVSLILMLMMGGKGNTQTLARDSIFAVVMMTMNGIVGLCLLAAAFRNHLAHFNAEGAGSALSAVILLAGLTLIVPHFTQSEPGMAFTPTQLIFIGVMSLIIYGLFVFTQTIRHRDVFLPPDIPGIHPDCSCQQPEMSSSYAESGSAQGVGRDALGAPLAPTSVDLASAVDDNEDDDEEDPSSGKVSLRVLLASAGLLLVALVDVVGLAKVESPGIESVVVRFGLPPALVGVLIALIILLPETISALKAANRGHMQTSLNLAYGSAMASIGLTIPVLAVASLWMPGSLHLGLEDVHIVLFAISAVVSILTIVRGRANVLQGGLHLTLFVAFLLLTILP
ncbi:MAG: ionic transporter y4hA [Coriobacteriia bacterium]|nr:ionic transporter y4hA [Coriobacteriia bacterium]